MSAAEPMIESAAPVATPTPEPVATPQTPAAPAAPPSAPLQFHKPAAPKGEVPRGTPEAKAHDPASESQVEWAKDMLPEERAWIKASGIENNSQAELARRFRNLETFKGVPSDQILRKVDWTDPESVEGYRKALELPADASGYEAKKIPMAIGELDAGEMREMAHAAALTPQQFETVTEWAAEYLSSQHNKNMELIALDDAAQMVEYNKSLGAARPVHEQLVNTALQAFEINEELFGALKNGLGGEANTRRFLARLGEKIGDPKAVPMTPDAGMGSTTPDGAKAQLDRLSQTPGYIDTLDSTKPTYSPDALAKHQRLMQLWLSRS